MGCSTAATYIDRAKKESTTNRRLQPIQEKHQVLEKFPSTAAIYISPLKKEKKK
jgi:hypothetical protein